MSESARAGAVLAQFEDVDFVVANEVSINAKRPVVAVDGDVEGADISYDHHRTGESVNILAIPKVTEMPRTVATPMIDTDAIVSASVVLLRASGCLDAVDFAFPVLHEASHHCDVLGSSGRYPFDSDAGLSLHFWLKEKGFSAVDLLCWRDGKVAKSSSGWRSVPDSAVKAIVFRDLVLVLSRGILESRIPSDTAWKARINEMAERVREALILEGGNVACIELRDGYLDPIAIYRSLPHDVVVTSKKVGDGRWGYSLGVRPESYELFDLTKVYEALSLEEPGWGGRRNAGGSPRSGSSIPPAVIIEKVRGVLE